MRRPIAVLAALVLMSAGFAACGGDAEPETASTRTTQATAEATEPAEEATAEATEESETPEAAGGDATEVAIEDFTFSPNPVEVKVGDTVKWTNADAAPHTATAEGEFDSKRMGQGGTFEYTAAKAGTFEYICTVHPSMKGTLEVAE